MTESTLAYLNNQQQHKQKFPLEWFDDPEFETRSGSEWVLLSKNFNKKGAVAVSRFFSYPESELEWKWAPCNVIDYDSKSDFYIIEWTETKQQKQVKRLNLLFEEENRERFFRRLEYAVKMRSETEFYVNHWESVRSRVPSASVSRLPNNIKKSLIAKFEIYENKNYEKSMKIVVGGSEKGGWEGGGDMLTCI